MFLGHFAVALGAKRVTPRTSLGALTLAAQLIDLAWPVLLLLGVERATIAPGHTRVTPLAFTHYPYTHSLLMVLVWALLAGVAWYAWQRDRRAALVMGALVFSHWLLDLLVHRPDLPLYPAGGAPRVGFGLWNSFGGTVAVEGGLFLLGSWLYLRGTRALDRRGRILPVAYLLALAVLYLLNLSSPPPPSVRVVALAGLLLWLFPLWSWWFDRHRVPRERVRPGAEPATAPHPVAG